MTISEWLKTAERKLVQAGVSTARLDALVLAEDVSGKDRSWLLANPELELSSAQVAKIEKLLACRARHEPLAYVRGKTEFYGRTFILTSAVLEPRPESETMIDILLKICAADPLFKDALDAPVSTTKSISIADVGAGSGALGITASLEVPNSHVQLLEIDEEALKVAKNNVDLFTLSINTIESNLLASAPQNYDVLLCNLPYIPDGHTINSAALHEPRLAIFGGPDGLDIYRRLFKQVAKLPNQPLYILCESLPPQHSELARIAAKSSYQLAETDDFIQAFKLTNYLTKQS